MDTTPCALAAQLSTQELREAAFAVNTYGNCGCIGGTFQPVVVDFASFQACSLPSRVQKRKRRGRKRVKSQGRERVKRSPQWQLCSLYCILTQLTQQEIYTMDNHNLEQRVAQLEQELEFWKKKFKRAGRKELDPVRRTRTQARTPDEMPHRCRQDREDRIRRLCEEPSQSPGNDPRNRPHRRHGHTRYLF